MKKFLKVVFIEIFRLLMVYALSGGVYVLIETLYRGFSTIEMYYLTGFLGVLGMVMNNIFSYDTDYILQTTILTFIGTISEGICGLIVNKDHHIWDYRRLFGTFFYNQCNIYFVIIWFILFLFLIPILDFIEWDLFHYKPNTPPYYMVFGHKISPFNKYKEYHKNHY